MYLSAYHFDGDLDVLIPAYERMNEMIPPSSFELHACVTRPGGITVFDACPDLETAEAFTANGQFQGTVQAAGLPTPRVERLGDVHRAFARGGKALA